MSQHQHQQQQQQYRAKVTATPAAPHRIQLHMPWARARCALSAALLCALPFDSQSQASNSNSRKLQASECKFAYQSAELDIYCGGEEKEPKPVSEQECNRACCQDAGCAMFQWNEQAQDGPRCFTSAVTNCTKTDGSPGRGCGMILLQDSLFSFRMINIT